MDAAEMKTLKERSLKLGQRLAQYEARDLIEAELKTMRLPEATRGRLVSRILTMAPISVDGELDSAGLKKIIEAEVKDESAYLAKLTEGRIVTGMGSVAAEELKPEEVAKAREASAGSLAKTLGLSDSAAKLFVAGRGAA
jgi:hypothetical protein